MPQTDQAEEKLPQIKAEDLTNQILGTPGFALDHDATLVVVAAALLAENDDNYSRSAAIGILQRARKVTPEILAQAVATVKTGMASSLTTFWRGFIDETWSGPDKPPQYVDPNTVATRKDQEEKEQESLRALADKYLASVQTAVAALGISEKDFPQPPAAKPKPRIDINPGKLAHGLVYKADEKKPEAKPVPGWLTPPLIDQNAGSFSIFDSDVMDVIGARKLSGDPAWKKLDDRGYTRAQIVAAIYEVQKTAHDQIGQCDSILSFIRNDYEVHFAPVIKTAVLLGHAVSVVNTFYVPLPTAQADDTAQTVVYPSSR